MAVSSPRCVPAVCNYPPTFDGLSPMDSRTVGHMKNSDEIREFLTSRRARITPEQAGLASYGRNRRVPGLRRDEVASLADISIQYYTKLERGNARGASDGVLEGIARALQLNEAERAHLFDLVRAANAASDPARRRASQPRVRLSIQLLLDSIMGPALVGNARMDVLAANRLGAALYSHMFDVEGQPNLARFLFLDRRAPELMAEWDEAVNDAVAILRAEAGRDPYDRDLSDLIGQLSTRSEEFRVRWAAHNVKIHRTGIKGFHHPLVGELTLNYEVLELPGDGHTMVVYTAEPSSPSADALKLLGSWAEAPAPMNRTVNTDARPPH